MDEILEQGRKQDRRKEIGLGIVILLGGVAYVLGMRALSGGAINVVSLGAIGVGATLIGHGLLRR